MTEYYKSTEHIFKNNTFYKPELSYHRNLERPLDKGLAEKWKKELSKRQILLFEFICGKYLEKWGYTRACNKTKFTSPAFWAYLLKKYKSYVKKCGRKPDFIFFIEKFSNSVKS
jgi:hypothetical protein